MVASQDGPRVHCFIVALPENPIASRLERVPRKPSQLLPWADPYIAKLVERLQTEVRTEQMAKRTAPTTRDFAGARQTFMAESPLRQEAEPPRVGIEFDSKEPRVNDIRRRRN